MRSSADTADAEKWRNGAVRAFLRHLEGRATLHGSAVAVGGRALVMLGESGSGKSTCAASLCSRLGAELLADDLAELDFRGDEVLVCPTDDHYWLYDDSACALGREVSRHGSKGRVLSGTVASSPTPLVALIALEFGVTDATPTVSRVRGRGTFAAINGAYVRFVVDDPDVQAHDLDVISTIARIVPVYTLTRPRTLGALDRSVTSLQQLLTSLEAPEATGAVSCG